MKPNVKQLIERIQSELPRLKDLQKGCLIKTKFYGIVELIYYDSEYNTANGICSKNLYRAIEQDNFEVLGKKPDLADVLEWLNWKYADVDLVLSNVNPYTLFINKDFYPNWNLSELIENQSDEMINFLLEI